MLVIRQGFPKAEGAKSKGGDKGKRGSQELGPWG